ncbi:ATP-binding protein [Kitasatospora sp. NPDC086791]|uniref:sensor histidine kinase n=1 Tax=Kitasatospora sp. NPDC086791 TaxID=3155178 RepID=UPI003434ACE8
MVANLLDLSRLQAGRVPVTLWPTDLADVLVAAVGSLPPGGSPVVLDLPEGLPPVEADTGPLERARANVLANARTWSPPGAPVRVDAGAVADRVDVRVVDRGPGIGDQEREHLFEPFHRSRHGPGRPDRGRRPRTDRRQGLHRGAGRRADRLEHAQGGTTFVSGLRRAASASPG